MELLEVNHLCKTYGSGETAVHALKDVSFSVPKGEYVAVVGESGSGKSTLLNLIGGLDTPTSGKVLIDGKDVFAMKDRELTIFRRRNIGFIFQAFNLIPELTVEQNILFPVLLDYQSRTGISGRTADCAESERPPEASAKPAFRWAAATGSHRPRLMTRPSLILADEPTGNLDTQNTSEVIALLKETSRKYEQTILMITHNRSIAQTADRVLQVSDGCLTDFGEVPGMSSTEMKSYLSLIPISAKVRRRQNRMTILCIVIAVFLVSAIFSVADMMLRTQMNRAAGKDGSWHLQIAGITQSQAEQLAQQPDVVCTGAGAVFNEGGEEDYRLNGKRVVLYGCDVQFLLVNRSVAFAGTFPEQDGEVLLGKGAARIFGVAIGDSVTLKLPDGQSRTLTVTGIGGVDESYYEMQFALVDIYLPQETFESLLTGQGEALPQTVYDLQYTSAAKAAKALPQLQQQYGEDAVHENLNVMGSAGQSNSTAFRTVYGMAGVLFALVLLAGVLMISGTMNSNIAQRTRFFGMMRCLGMSKQQVVHFVRMEALNWCRIAIPIGLVLGTFSSWAVCGALRYGIGGEFATTPVFRLSMGGLCAGAVVGVVTVLLAAQAPAKQAAEVPPVAAASGSEQAAVVHHAANLAPVGLKLHWAYTMLPQAKRIGS